MSADEDFLLYPMDVGVYLRIHHPRFLLGSSTLSSLIHDLGAAARKVGEIAVHGTYITVYLPLHLLTTTINLHDYSHTFLLIF